MSGSRLPVGLPIGALNHLVTGLLTPRIAHRFANDSLLRFTPLIFLAAGPALAMTSEASPGRRRPRSGGGYRQMQRLSQELSDRDWRILDDLARLRVLSGQQIQRLHFSGHSSRTAARRTRATMHRMHQSRLVERSDRRIGGMRSGSSGYVFGLSPRGRRLVGSGSPLGGNRARTAWQPSPWFLDHLLAVSELYVDLREWERSGDDFELLRFDAEPVCWRRWSGFQGRATLKPDAHVVLGHGEMELHAFVEVDLATEGSAALRRKAEAYVAYWRSGLEQHEHGVFPRVVFLVPDERRRQQVVDVLSRLPAETWQLFQVGLLADAASVLTTSPQNLAGGAS